MFKMRVAWIPLLAVVLVLAYFFNPTPEQHREKIKQVVSERSQIEQVLGIGSLSAFVSKYHSLGVASYTTVNDRVSSIGVLGMVFVR
jgi:LytS/YehU family sensor histidine kinase